MKSAIFLCLPLPAVIFRGFVVYEVVRRLVKVITLVNIIRLGVSGFLDIKHNEPDNAVKQM